MSTMLNFEQARFNMIEQQVRPWEVLDPAVLAAMTAVRREDFVPTRYRKLAFADVAIPLEEGEQMLKPVIEGRLLQALELSEDDEVLHIGTGSGFFAACLSRLARLVTSVERHATLAQRAKSKIQAADIHNLSIVHADAFNGFSPAIRFDAIVATGAVHTLPEVFRQWLAPGGRILIVRGESPVLETVLLTDVGSGLLREESLFETDIPYLAGAEPPRRFSF
ncbi:MAG: protein-L-isoaspartate O-methyltransferase [Xanthomonadales bacterium]|nr:protein-L-isoaspartate O-methyltransferase [Xanthomonadales bacterium]